MSARQLCFEPAGHRYSAAGRDFPSVSRILRPLWAYSAAIPSGILAQKAAIGSAAHKAAELHDGGRLDPRSVHEAVRPYLDAWIKFRAEKPFEPAHSELRVWHPALGFAGTLDVLGHMAGAPALIDLKCTAAIMPGVGPQTAAYREATIASPDIPEEIRELARAARRWCVQLRPDGSYRLEPQDDPNDWRVFLALLTLFNFKSHHAKHYENASF